MNAQLDFGSVKDIKSEFQYLMTTSESDFEVEFNYYFRITDDNYIQLANSFEKENLKILYIDNGDGFNAEEIKENNRARSAKLRVAEKI